MPRFRIEYLIETTEEDSVCHVLSPAGASLQEAGEHAYAAFDRCHQRFGATGFQIRDMSTEHGEIVALETID